MKKVCFLAMAVAALDLLSGPFAVRGQTAADFTHPADRHLGLDDPKVYIGLPELLAGPDEVVVQRPTLVILMEFSNMPHRAVHPAQFWHDLIFADPPAAGQLSLRQIVRENSNGRLLLVPALAGDIYDGNQDGVVGWVASTNTYQAVSDPSVKRAEAVRVADPLFDYWRYDNNNDGVITTDELLIIAIFADNAAADYRPTAEQHNGHADLPNSESRPGGNTRPTNPSQVDVDQDTGHAKKVYQHIAGMGEIAYIGVVAHEVGHSTLGLGDLYLNNPEQAVLLVVTNGYTVDGDWYPPPPGIYSLMDSYWQEYTMHLDPWAKIHLGFTRPLVVRHDGTYTLYETEVTRSWAAQQAQPMAAIISDGQRDSGYQEYFILENRNQAPLPDHGLAVWLINEDPFNLRKVVRLVRRGGHWAEAFSSLWDGVDAEQGYDLTPTSVPRNTAWTDGSPSWVEIKDISPAGSAVTFTVRLRPVFVDWRNTGFENGWPDHPFNTIPKGIAAIDEPPRTVMIAPGVYTGVSTITKPCTLMAWTGTVVISP